MEGKAARIVFMGTPQFAVPTLLRLLDSQYPVVAVYTRRDKPAGRGRQVVPSPVKQVALERGIPLHQPATLRRPEEVERLRDLRPHVVVVAAYGLILPPEILSVPPLGCLNVHPSLLPRHRGPSPVAGALLAGDAISGVTIMLMDEGTDTGPILRQRTVPILPTETTGTLTARLAEVGADLLLEVLPDWLAGRITPCPQDPALATYTRPLRKEDGKIDWNRPAAAIERQVRALNPWPGCFTFWGDRRLIVLEARAAPVEAAAEPGTVLPAPPPVPNPPSPLTVQTADGVLFLLRVQAEGRRPATGEEFLRGQPVVRGGRLR